MVFVFIVRFTWGWIYYNADGEMQVKSMELDIVLPPGPLLGCSGKDIHNMLEGHKNPAIARLLWDCLCKHSQIHFGGLGSDDASGNDSYVGHHMSNVGPDDFDYHYLCQNHGNQLAETNDISCSNCWSTWHDPGPAKFDVLNNLYAGQSE